MTSPKDVAEFHAQYDKHSDDRVRLFGAVAQVVPAGAAVLYPGSYIDIAASVFFDDVTYVDLDRRAAKFFAESGQVEDLVAGKRQAVGKPAGKPRIKFVHQDYRAPLPVEGESVGLLVSLYAGFISEFCTDALTIGGTLLVNPSHGDAAMASIDPRYELTGVVKSDARSYRITTDQLDSYLVPKRAQEITVESLHKSGRGIAYTRPAFAYLFTRVN